MTEISMVRQEVIELVRLQQYFQEVLPQLESFQLTADSQDFERNFALFEQRLGQ